MTDDAPDSRLHEQRLAAQWAHAYADGTLPVVLDALYAHEINVGMQSFWDNGWDVWLGDLEWKGRVGDVVSFSTAAEIAPWLIKTAEDYYPLLRTARLTMSARVPPEFDEAQVDV